MMEVIIIAIVVVVTLNIFFRFNMMFLVLIQYDNNKIYILDYSFESQKFNFSKKSIP